MKNPVDLLKYPWALHSILVAMFPVLSCLTVGAEEEEGPKKVALVIGVDDYAAKSADAAASTGRADAELVGQTLKRAGFQVMQSINPKRKDLEEVLKKFAGTIGKGSLAVVYFSGDGASVSGRTHLLAAGASFDKGENLEQESIDPEEITAVLDQAGARYKVLFLDCGRSVPPNGKVSWSDRTKKTPRLFGGINGDGVMIFYATSPGKPREHTEGSVNSAMALALSETIPEGLELNHLIKEAIRDVAKRTGGDQRGWMHGTLIEKVYLGEAQ